MLRTRNESTFTRLLNGVFFFKVFKYHNKYHNSAPKDAVYIGRGSPWGNPYVIGKHGTRDEVIDRFKEKVLPTLDLEPLIGKDLVCFCKPQRCHGDEIIKYMKENKVSESIFVI